MVASAAIPALAGTSVAAAEGDTLGPDLPRSANTVPAIHTASRASPSSGNSFGRPRGLAIGAGAAIEGRAFPARPGGAGMRAGPAVDAGAPDQTVVAWL
jgi:hypothetical protein